MKFALLLVVSALGQAAPTLFTSAECNYQVVTGTTSASCFGANSVLLSELQAFASPFRTEVYMFGARQSLDEPLEPPIYLQAISRYADNLNLAGSGPAVLRVNYTTARTGLEGSGSIVTLKLDDVSTTVTPGGIFYYTEEAGSIDIPVASIPQRLEMEMVTNRWEFSTTTGFGYGVFGAWFQITSIDVIPAGVPEPATMSLAAFGITALAIRSYRRRSDSGTSQPGTPSRRS